LRDGRSALASFAPLTLVGRRRTRLDLFPLVVAVRLLSRRLKRVLLTRLARGFTSET